MKSTIEDINSVQKRLKIECETEEVNQAFLDSYKNVKKKAKIQGFRPGKAPIEMIKKLYGASVAGEVADQLIRKHLFEAISSNELNPVSTPVLETNDLPSEGEAFNFSVIIDQMPEFEVKGYKGLKLEYQSVEIDDERVSKELNELRRRQANTKEVEEGTKAKEGLLIRFDQHAYDNNGEEIKSLQSNDVPAELGQGALLPELETALEGMGIDEEKTTKLTIPEEYQDPDLAGKEVDVKIKIKGLQELILPELDDEFAKDLGVDSLDELRKLSRQQLERDAENFKRSQLENGIFQQLEKDNQFEIPPAIVDQIIDSMIEEIPNQDKNAKAKMKSDQEFRSRAMPEAKLRARNTLLLLEIIKQEDLKVTDEDVEAHFSKMMPPSDDEKQQEMLKNIIKNVSDKDRENLLFSKAIDFIIGESELTATPQT